MGHDTDHEDDGSVVVEESRPKLKRPPMYKVILLNDDYTPMDFVVYVLERFFRMDTPMATKIMLDVHTQGKGVCGIYPRDIAETKVGQVNEFSKKNKHPLKCVMEVE